MIDEFGNGVPLAFCLSERENEKTITAFLHCVSKFTGQIQTEYFMSDDASQLFNSWRKIMGDATKILCSWHVYKNWKKQVKEMVISTGRQKQILDRLVAVRNERDFEKAKSNFEKLISELASNSSTESFAKYLKSYYFKRMDQWLYCRRGILIPNTNMHIEQLHRLIKIVYMKC
jgi:hypothetical protein